MKKKSILLVALSTLMAASLGLGVLTACDSAEEVKASEYVNGTNFYYGDGQDVHLQGWITSVTNDAWTVEEGFVDEDAEGAPVVTRLGYSKNDAWRNFGVKIDGNYSDFSYLNITMRAETRGLTPGAVNVNMKIVNPIPEKDGVNVLGSDLYFDVSMDTYTTYSFQIPSIYREILDVTNDVCLFPEPGIANSDVIHAGDIYVKDMWFSKERPADGVTPVDDTWRTEAWCGYEVTRGGESEAIISYNRPADWSRFYRPVPYDEIFMEDGTVNNMLKLQFTSDTVTIGETVYEDSVEQFQVGLWGNVKPGSSEGYYQQWFGQYYRDKYEDTNDWSNNPSVFKVEKDEETGIVTLYCRVAPALMAMEGNYDEQIWICFNLESQPQGGGSDQAPGYIHGPVEFDGIGQMTILSSEFYFDENEPVYSEPVVNDSGWNSSVAGAYTVSSEKAGVTANVTYKDLAPDMWCCVAYAINGTAEGNTLTIQLKNNGEEKVLYGIDWNSEATRQYGYIEPGATAEIRLQNEAMTGAVNLFLDSCYPGYDSSVTDPHSGDVDIVSMAFTNEEIAPPEKPDDPDPVDVAWGVVDSGKSLYAIKEGENIDAKVQYSGVSPNLWANLYRDVSADECKPNVKLTLRNNGEEKVLYGAELGAEETRKYGWIEPGQTVTVELNNENVYTVINLFLDCCYQGDYTTDKTALSGDVDILSVTFSGEFEASDPEPVGSDWVAQNDAYFTVNGNTVTLNALPIGSWTGVRTDLTLTGAGKVTLAVTNSTDHWIKLKLNLQDASGAQIGADSDPAVCWMEIPVGSTYDLNLVVTAEQAAAAKGLLLMIDCWAAGDKVTETGEACPAGPYSGTVTLGEVKFTPDTSSEPEQPEEGDVIEGTPAAQWSFDKTDVTNPYTFSNENGTYTITYSSAIGWKFNIASGYTFTPAVNANVNVTITNPNDAAIVVRIDLMKNGASGWETLLQGTEITIGANDTVTISLPVSAGQEIAGILAFLDVNNATQSGSVVIAPVTMTTAGAAESPAEKDITDSLTFVKAGENDPTTVEGNKVTWTGLSMESADGNWSAGFKAEYDMADGETTIKITLKNTSDHAVRVQASLRNIAWNPEFGSTGVIIGAGEETTITITLSASDAAQVGIISFYCDIWPSWGEGYDQRPEGPVSGSMEIVSVKVS